MKYTFVRYCFIICLFLSCIRANKPTTEEIDTLTSKILNNSKSLSLEDTTVLPEDTISKTPAIKNKKKEMKK